MDSGKECQPKRDAALSTVDERRAENAWRPDWTVYEDPFQQDWSQPLWIILQRVFDVETIYVYQGRSNSNGFRISDVIQIWEALLQRFIHCHLPEKPAFEISPWDYRIKKGREGRNQKHDQARNSRLFSIEQKPFVEPDGHQHHRQTVVRKIGCRYDTKIPQMVF